MFTRRLRRGLLQTHTPANLLRFPVVPPFAWPSPLTCRVLDPMPRDLFLTEGASQTLGCRSSRIAVRAGTQQARKVRLVLSPHVALSRGLPVQTNVESYANAVDSLLPLFLRQSNYPAILSKRLLFSRSNGAGNSANKVLTLAQISATVSSQTFFSFLS